MNPEDSQRLEACLLEAAEILYRNTQPEELANFESLEKAVRTKMKRASKSKNRFFFIKQVTGTEKGRERVVKSIVGKVTVTEKQAQILGLKPYSQLSPLFEKNSVDHKLSETNAIIRVSAIVYRGKAAFVSGRSLCVNGRFA